MNAVSGNGRWKKERLIFQTLLDKRERSAVIICSSIGCFLANDLNAVIVFQSSYFQLFDSFSKKKFAFGVEHCKGTIMACVGRTKVMAHAVVCQDLETKINDLLNRPRAPE
jgi:hypothetical protein